MKKGLVSIVLPIYNVEKYLNRCMDSVVNQTYKNLEIIMVDDGSTDACSQMCDEWLIKDARVKVVHKENQGLGMARNTGIENATGEYVCFFDSDDYIANDTIERLYDMATRESADIVTFGFHVVDKNGSITSTVLPDTEKESYVGDEIEEIFLPDLISKNPHTGKETKLWMSAWASMFSLKLISEIEWKFVSEREVISEDVYSLLWLYKSVNKVCVLPIALYHYCENDTNSLTRIFRKDRYQRLKFFYEKSIAACDELDYSEEIKERLAYPFLGSTFGAMKRIAISDYGYREKLRAMKGIVCDDTFHRVVMKLELSKESITRKILFYLLRKKHTIVSYYLFLWQGRKTLK